MPSLASKVTLASSIFITGGIIVGVHYYQFDERQQVNERFKRYVMIKNWGLKFIIHEQSGFKIYYLICSSGKELNLILKDRKLKEPKIGDVLKSKKNLLNLFVE